ncbi:hypothetical protein ACFMQL_20360 [Nonomuraea fastidiosa]|uniref:hypothetical protein n=1 Tax=Nonomuraea fastidiosa TaxID=46173 RepID=UPI00366C8141
MSANPLHDQIEAAAAHMERIAANLFAGGKVEEPGGWVQQVADEFMAAFRKNHDQCDHLGSPQPVFGTVAQPGVLRCVRCFTDWFEAKAWSRCDRCGRECDPSANAITVGALMIVVCLCQACHDALAAGQAEV